MCEKTARQNQHIFTYGLLVIQANFSSSLPVLNICTNLLLLNLFSTTFVMTKNATLGFHLFRARTLPLSFIGTENSHEVCPFSYIPHADITTEQFNSSARSSGNIYGWTEIYQFSKVMFTSILLQGDHNCKKCPWTPRAAFINSVIVLSLSLSLPIQTDLLLSTSQQPFTYYWLRKRIKKENMFTFH